MCSEKKERKKEIRKEKCAVKRKKERKKERKEKMSLSAYSFSNEFFEGDKDF